MLKYKFCNYNLVLNEEPYNKDVIHVVYIVNNKEPNNNDAIWIANNVHLTIMGAQQFWMAAM